MSHTSFFRMYNSWSLMHRLNGLRVLILFTESDKTSTLGSWDTMLMSVMPWPHRSRLRISRNLHTLAMIMHEHKPHVAFAGFTCMYCATSSQDPLLKASEGQSLSP